VIGVTTTTRIASLPDIPTLDEQGLTGFEVVVWWGVYAPKGTPKPALDRLVSALQDAIKDVDFRTNLANVGAEPVALNRATPDALGARLRTEIGKWGPIIKNTGQYAD
jgi:tripartite-type tricarboxylate transporter receptor subunit TctC